MAQTNLASLTSISFVASAPWAKPVAAFGAGALIQLFVKNPWARLAFAGATAYYLYRTVGPDLFSRARAPGEVTDESLAKRDAEETQRMVQATQVSPVEKPAEEKVDEASWESFPASDPPAY